MARPAKDDAEKLSRKVTFRMTEQDFAAYKAKFKKAHVSQSEFFRQHVLTNSTQVVVKTEHKRAVLQLQRCGNNINQLAHRAHAANLAGTLSEATFKAILRQLERLENFVFEQVESTKR